MKSLFESLTRDYDFLIKEIIPHIGSFKNEIMILKKKQLIFDMIDKMISKYDDILLSIEKDDKI